MLSEIDAITKVLHMSRTEWIRMKLAHAIHEDTLNLSEAIALEYAKGRLTKEDIRALLGNDADDVIFVVDHLKQGKKELIEMIEKGEL